MTNLWLLVAILASPAFIGCVDPENRHFIFTAPKRFLAGSNENVCISFFNTTEPVYVNVAIYDEYSNSEIATAVEKVVTDFSIGKCFKIWIPRTSTERGRLQLKVNFKTEGDYKIISTRQITIQTDPDVTFIQTDKPVYNGEQIVKFRIFTIKYDLMTVHDPIDVIWIENPHGIRVAQWLKETPQHGFIEKRFELSSEPYNGKWYIRVKKENQDVISQSFLIADYVLPRFIVTIQAPDSVYASTNFNFTVCAKYNFGKPVQGDVAVSEVLKCTSSFFCKKNETTAKELLKLDEDGCKRFERRSASKNGPLHYLFVEATVAEEGTNVKSKTSVKINIRSRHPSPFQILVPSEFKLGLPLQGHVLFDQPNDKLEATSECTVNSSLFPPAKFLVMNGTGSFVIFMPNKSAKKIERSDVNFDLEVSCNEKAKKKVKLTPWFSPSSSYLKIESVSSGEVLKCNSVAEFKLIYTIPDSGETLNFYYMIQSRGDILLKGVISQNQEDSKMWSVNTNTLLVAEGDLSGVREFTFSLSLTESMSASSYLIVYHIRGDGEVVADTKHLVMERCFKNQVKLTWGKNESSPNSLVNLQLVASSGSVCALSVTDKSVKDIPEFFKMDKSLIFDSVEKFQIKPRPWQFESKVSKRVLEGYNVERPNEMELFSPRTRSGHSLTDSSRAFDEFGVIVISNLGIKKLESKELNSRSKNSTSQYSPLGSELENLQIAKRTEAFDVQRWRQYRSFFPETWIWEAFNVSSSIDFQWILPDTLTEWNADVVCLSDEHGIGIAQTSKINTFREFFLDFNPPQSVRKKEIFYLEVTLFNYFQESAWVNITYLPSENVVLKSNASELRCLTANSKESLIFPLEAVSLGKTKLIVSAEILHFSKNCSSEETLDTGSSLTGNFDKVIKETVVKEDGYSEEDIFSRIICGNDGMFDKNVSWSVKLPFDAIESSLSVTALISGDILGPGLTNVDRLIMLPTGCGEQNMILLVPNLLLLEYLLSTKRESVDLVEAALRNLDLGYQRQLNYRRSDGSYSAFGEQDKKGSIWLTAFVVRYFSQAGKFIHIDKNDLAASVKWIVNNQLENGCFPAIGKVYHRTLKEKMPENESSKILTAYILISLIESGMFAENSTIIRNALYCLKADDNSYGLYGDLITAYALTLAGKLRDARIKMVDLLDDASRSYQMLWWESDESSSIESSIEMTSYGILTMVNLGGPFFLASASDAVRWISQYRNENGGFLSTQDTVVALEAISKFSTILPGFNDDETLVVRLKTSETQKEFNMTQLGRLQQQQYKFPNYPTHVTFETEGNGCAIVQTKVNYYSKRKPTWKELSVHAKIEPVSVTDKNYIQKFEACVRNGSPRGKINMAVLEVAMISGFYPDRSSLYNIRTSRKGVQRWEEYENKVLFYFEDLKNKNICVQFLIVQEICVENRHPALIQIYDYYDHKRYTSTKYNVKTKCDNESWLDLSSSSSSEKIKVETKRDVTTNGINETEIPQPSNGLVEINYDLEVPKTGGGVMPVYALPPPKTASGPKCPHCLNSVPELFPKMYCSSQAAVEVFVRSKEKLEVNRDITPRRNVTLLRRTISFTIKRECVCDVLNTVNSNALLLVTPPRSIRFSALQEIHLDDFIQLYPLDKGNELPKFVTDAMVFCQNWDFNDE